MTLEQILKLKYAPKDAEPAPKVDASTLSELELILRQRHCPDTLATEPLQAPVLSEALPMHKEVVKASVMSAEELAEIIEVELRNRQLIELAKQDKLNKGKQ
jgi:hypothetical protein